MHLFSQESEALTSQQNGTDGTTCSIANGRSFRVKSSSIISPTPNNMKTSKTSTQLSIEDELMFSAEVSPVNRLALQENERDQRTNATCGRRCLELSESVNPVGSWARTFAGLLIGQRDWYSKRVALTWRILGTPSNRLLFQLAESEPFTDDIGHGLLPTPTTGADQGTQYKQGGKSLRCFLNLEAQLSPLFVEEMMGFPKNWTALPFQSGEENLSKPMETL